MEAEPQRLAVVVFGNLALGSTALQAAVQRTAIDSQHFRRALFVATLLLQDQADEALILLGQRWTINDQTAAT